jgi:CrcB protein
MRTIVAIGTAGALGALARYGLDGVVSRRLPTSFPWGTFVVNISGALVLGFLLTLMTEQLTTAPWLRSALTIGFLGAYTTFSTLSLDTFRLLEEGHTGQAGFNALGSLAAGLVAVWLGLKLGRVV